MIYCKKCLYPENHPLSITFNENGICSGCIIHEEKDNLNWEERYKILERITDSYKNKSDNNYDCIVPVSGARDSFFILDMVINKLNLNPLLVTYNKQYNTDIGVRNLAKLRKCFDCDIITMTVNPDKVKKITKATLRRFGSIYWHCIAGQTVFPVQIAVKFKIPLIIWGAHQGIDQVGMFSHLNEVEMTRKYRKEHDLMGFEAEDLINEFDGISYDDIYQYKYPDDIELERVGVRGIYLNNYIRWDTKLQHELMIKKYNYETSLQNRTFDTYNDVDCYNYSDLHDYIKLIKFGYSKVIDHVCREIRFNRISRESGIELVKKYVFKKPQNLYLFLKWIGMTENGLNYILDQHRNKEIWIKDANWNWILKDEIFNFKLNDENINKKNELQFKITEKYYSSDKTDEYILIGKGV
jgi:N-acetyl sugar amidotransferase